MGFAWPFVAAAGELLHKLVPAHILIAVLLLLLLLLAVVLLPPLIVLRQVASHQVSVDEVDLLIQLLS
jgi:hypothetical protein